MPTTGIIFHQLHRIIFAVSAIKLGFADACAITAQPPLLIPVATNVPFESQLARISAIKARVTGIATASPVDTQTASAAEVGSLAQAYRLIAGSATEPRLAFASIRSTQALAGAVVGALDQTHVACLAAPSPVAFAGHG